MDRKLPLTVVCRVLGAPRSTIYARRRAGQPPGRPGPVPAIGDQELVGWIRQVLAASPFAGEGYRKVRARLRRERNLQVSGKRVLRLLRAHGLLAPPVRGRRKPHPHDGTIIPDAPNLRWGTDATMAWTRSDGWVWVFAVVDHYTAEAWAHVAKVGTGSLPCSRSTTPSSTGGAPSARTWPVGFACATTGDPSTAPGTSSARSPGWASPTTPRSWASRRPTAAPSGGSAPSRSSACGPSCTTLWTSCAKPSPASFTPTTPSG
jgi:hypothetical protein